MIIAQKVRNLNFKSTENISFCALYKRVERILKNNFYLSRKATHIGQTIPSQSINLCYNS